MNAITIPERFSLPNCSLLNSIVAPATRADGQPIVLGNYGAYNDFNEVEIGAVNVGTVLSLLNRLDGYLYVEVFISGNCAKLSVFGTAGNLAAKFTVGSDGDAGGDYVCQIPYVGGIESLFFEQTGYVITDIRVTYPSGYSIEQTDLAQFTITPTSGWTLTNGVYSKSWASSLAAVVNFAGTLLPGYVGRLGIQIIPDTFPPNTTPSVQIYNDGVNPPVSIPMLTRSKLWVPIPSGAGILFDNNLSDPVEILLTPVVASFLPVATAFGADAAAPSFS